MLECKRCKRVSVFKRIGEMLKANDGRLNNFQSLFSWFWCLFQFDTGRTKW